LALFLASREVPHTVNFNDRQASFGVHGAIHSEVVLQGAVAASHGDLS
jgi:hypothetical protein